jgi:hypothetical protein
LSRPIRRSKTTLAYSPLNLLRRHQREAVRSMDDDLLLKNAVSTVKLATLYSGAS